MINAMFSSAQPTLLEFPNERPVFMREYSVGTYSTMAYTMGKLCTEIPLSIAQCFLQVLIIYYMVSLQGNFFVIVGSVFSTAICSASIAVLLGCLVTDPKQANEVMPLALVPQILFAGFFIRTSLIPFWLRYKSLFVNSPPPAPPASYPFLILPPHAHLSIPYLFCI
jgi:hypothetical protein